MSTSTPDSVTVSFDPTALQRQADIIPGATPSQAGVMTAAQAAALAGGASNPVTPTSNGLMTPAMLAQLNESLALQDVNIYLSTTGSDSNDGLTPATPVATLGKAVSLLPAAWTKGVKVFCGAGTFAGLAGSTIRDGRLGPNATPVAFIGAVVDVGGGTRTGVGSTNLLLNDPIATFVGILGKAVRITSGAAAGQRRLVAAFTGTTITPNAPFTGIVGGETFVVEGAGTTFTGFGGVVTCGMRDIRLAGITSFVVGSFITGENLEIDASGGGNSAAFTTMQTQFFSNPVVWGNDPNNPFSALRTQCGAYLHGGSFSFFTDATSFGSFVVAETATITVARNSTLFFSGVVSKNTTWNIQNEGLGFFPAGATGLSNVLDGQVTPTATTAIVNVTQNGMALLNQTSPSLLLTIQNSGGAAVRASSGGRVFGNGIDGTGNTGVGFLAERGSIINLIGPAGVPNATVTGTGGDVKVGALAAQAYATLAAQSGQGETDGAGNSTLNRIIVSTAF